MLKSIKIILLIVSFCFVFLLGMLFDCFVIRPEVNLQKGRRMMAEYFYKEIEENFGTWSRHDSKEKGYEVFGGIDLKGPARIDFIIKNDVKTIIVYEYR